MSGLADENYAGFLCLLGVINALVGAWGRINQTYMGPLMGYSSVGHTGWMLSVAGLSDYGAMLYLLGYSVVLFPVIVVMNEAGATRMNMVTFIIYLGPQYRRFFCATLLRLAGMPPFGGFYLKVWVVAYLTWTGYGWAGVGLVLGTVISLGVYIRIVVLGMLINAVIIGPGMFRRRFRMTRYLMLSAWVSLFIAPVGVVRFFLPVKVVVRSMLVVHVEFTWGG